MVSLYGAVERKLNIRKETFDKIISDESAKQEICEALFHCLENEPEIAETVSVLLQYIAERDEHTDDGAALDYEDVRDNYQARFFLRNGNHEPEVPKDVAESITEDSRMDSEYDEWLEENLDKFSDDSEEIAFHKFIEKKYKKSYNSVSAEEAETAYKEFQNIRADANDEEGRWITTENNHKVHLNEEGEPDKGNPHVIAAMNGESSGKKAKRRAASFVESKKTSLTPEQRSDYSSKLSEIRSKIFEEKDYQSKRAYKTKGYNPEEYKASDERQKQLKAQSNELFKSMPVGTIITQGTNLYEKTDEGKWTHHYPSGRKIERKDSDVSSFLCGAIEENDYPPVKFAENANEVEMITDIGVKDEGTYKDWAKDIGSLERKDLVKKAKKDPEFKAVVDSIVLYTEGGYPEQRKIAEEVVRNGTENASALTIGEYANGNFYTFRDLWKDEKLKTCDTPIAEGMAHLIGAVNNSEPSTTPLFRVAQDRNIAKVGSDFEPYVPPKVGDKIRIDAPTSFTASKEVEEELSKQKMGDIIHYELEPGANALNIEALSRYKQAESLCCGEFEVVSVDVKARAVPLFNDRDITDAVRKRGIKENEYGKYTERYEVKVKIRQVAKTEIGKREDSDNAYYDCREHFEGRMVLFDSRSDADDDTEWITVNGTPVPLDDEGKLSGKIGEKIKSTSTNQNKKATGRNTTDKNRDYDPEENEKGAYDPSHFRGSKHISVHDAPEGALFMDTDQEIWIRHGKEYMSTYSGELASPEELSEFGAYPIESNGEFDYKYGSTVSKERMDSLYWRMCKRELDETGEISTTPDDLDRMVASVIHYGLGEDCQMMLATQDPEHYKDMLKWNKEDMSGYKRAADSVEEFIAKSQKYYGSIYRGMSFNTSTQDENAVRKLVDGLKEGKEVSFGHIASWSINEGVAESYADSVVNLELEKGENISVVYSLPSPKSAASLDGINPEGEVLSPKAARYRITSVSDWYDKEFEISRYTVKLEEI